MIKPVSTLSIIVAGVMCIAPTFGAQMTPQIQRLLDQKQEKIKKLEECDGKRKGWMIAGISTIGVTAVGVGVNIAQASKSNRLSDEIDTARHDLEKKQEDLSRIQNQIAEKEQESTGGSQSKSTSQNLTKQSSSINSCDCAGCKKNLSSKGECNSSKDGILVYDEWLYVCDNGCWKGPDTVNWRGVPDCAPGQADNLSNKYNVPATYNMVYYDANGEDITDICKVIDGKPRICYRDINGSFNYDIECEVSNPGDWKVVFSDGEVQGISACSSDSPVDGGQVDSAPNGPNCYCKAQHPKEGGWFYKAYLKTEKECARLCASACANDIVDRFDTLKDVF